MTEKAQKNLIAGEALAFERKKMGLTQSQMAERLAKKLQQSYSHRQYQRLEEGLFPKYKTEVIVALDDIIQPQVKFYDIIYNNVDREKELTRLRVDRVRESVKGLGTSTTEKHQLNDEAPPYSGKNRSIEKLIENNRLLAEAAHMNARTIAEMWAQINSGKPETAPLPGQQDPPDQDRKTDLGTQGELIVPGKFGVRKKRVDTPQRKGS